MINLMRLGDTTNHGGEVLNTSNTMRYGGRRLAREDDHVKFPQHAELELNLILVGKRAATQDHKCPVITCMPPRPPAESKLPG
jgi:uncharacterized Zn-binding protein involved in type VI secretion